MTRLHAHARWVFAALALPALALAAPIAREELTALCANAEDQAQCGRLVEARQLTRLSRIAERVGDELRVSLSPFGLTIFRDTVNVTGATSYAVWDYLEKLDTLVLFTTDGDRSGFLLLQRHGGGEYRVPSEPVMAPDERHFATADFCANDCDNRVAVWRIERNGVRKESTWSPPTPWSDVSVTWRNADTIALEYSRPDDAQPRTLLRRLGDPSWQNASTK
ncbi:MAG TPA: hypothetical protein VKU81_00655 [Casimicrobiaceae bacterium]|nr:hypothetical protein [Casimicrobiaceae bacterium]